MGAARLWSASFLRRRAMALVGLMLVIGLGAGFALTAAGGARRAASGWERFRAATLAPDAVVSLPPDASTGTLDQVAQLPVVAAAAPFGFLPIAPVGLRADVDVTSLVALDEGFGDTVYRPRIVEGRHPDAGRADEVTMNQALADRTGFRVGQRVPLVGGLDPAELTDLGEVTVVGVHAGTFDIGPEAGGGTLLVPAEFFRAHHADLEPAPPAAVVRLRGGEAAVPRFTQQVTAVAGAGAFVTSAHEDGEPVADALRVQAVALWLLVAVAGGATLVAGSQALGRVLADAVADRDVLGALGLSPGAVRALGVVPAVVVAAGAAVVAGVVAVAASPRLPTGLARRLEIDHGFSVDPLTLSSGVGLMFVALAAAGLRSCWRLSSGPRPAASSPGRSSRAGPVTLGIGAGWVLTPARGPAAVAARSAVVAVGAGITGVVAIATFTASLHHLFTAERFYGWDFHGALVTTDGTRGGFEEVVAGLKDDPAVTGLAHGGVVRMSVGGRTVEGFAIDPVRGRAHPTLLSGRPPVGEDEVALGAANVEQLGSDLGDVVAVDGERNTRMLRIVGVAAFPELGDDSDMASGGLVTRAGADALGLEPSSDVALVAVAPTADVGTVLARHTRQNVEPVLPFEPSRVSNMHEVGAVPALLGGFLALLAAAAIGQALAMNVRAQRCDIGILRTLGLVRSQVREVVAAQAAVTVAVGLVVGLPFGLVVGRWGWTLIARDLGVLERPVVPWSATVATVAVAFVIAGLVAALPARAAARLRPAHILRSE